MKYQVIERTDGNGRTVFSLKVDNIFIKDRFENILEYSCLEDATQDLMRRKKRDNSKIFDDKVVWEVE